MFISRLSLRKKFAKIAKKLRSRFLQPFEYSVVTLRHHFFKINFKQYEINFHNLIFRYRILIDFWE